MSPTREELLQWDREVVWHAFTQMAEYKPVVFERGDGCILTDIHGSKFIDGVSSLWCNIHGHRHPRLDDAIRDQLERVAHVTSLGASNSTTIKLAKRLVDLAPTSIDHVFFSDDGATAIEVALKMAFQYWHQRRDPRPEKNSYVAFENAYHGDTLGSVSVGGVARFHQMFGPLLFDVVRSPAPNMYRLPAGVTRESACGYYLAQLDQLLEQHAEKVAALVIEPLVQAAAGMLVHPPGFLQGVRELTRKYDILLIADEVAVGMGRTGTMLACDQENVAPDFLCLAKGLTGGYLPLAATLTTNEVWQAFLGDYSESKTFFHGHTYGGNPLGAAAAIATLDVFVEEDTLSNLSPKIERLAAFLARIGEHPNVGDVRQRGLIGAIELVKNQATRQPFDWQEERGQKVCDHAWTEGVWLRPLGNVVVIMPPLSITVQQLDKIGHAVEQGIDRATKD